MTQRREGKVNYLLFIFPTIAFITILTLFPLLYSIFISFTDYKIISNEAFHFIGIKNYSALFEDRLFQRALLNTLIVVANAVAFEFFVGFLIALIFFNYIHRFRKAIQSLLILPLAITPVAVALMWKYMFNSTYGVINYFLSVLHIQNVDWLGAEKTALISVIIVDIWQWTPFVFIIAMAGLEAIPQKIIEMAEIDGVNKWQMFRYILLPNLLPFMSIALLIRIIDGFKIFDSVYVLTEGGPGSATETLSLLGYRLGFIFFNSSAASAESIVILLIVTGLVLLFLRTLRNLSNL